MGFHEIYGLSAVHHRCTDLLHVMHDSLLAVWFWSARQRLEYRRRLHSRLDKP